MANPLSQVEVNLVKEVQQGLSGLGPALIQSKLSEQEILAQSTLDGGPSSVQEALVILMDDCGVGIRQLAQSVNLGRKKVQAMLNGEATMSQEVFSAVYRLCKARKPERFSV